MTSTSAGGKEGPAGRQTAARAKGVGIQITAGPQSREHPAGQIHICLLAPVVAKRPMPGELDNFTGRGLIQGTCVEMSWDQPVETVDVIENLQSPHVTCSARIRLRG
jgi:hypothetical protein